MNRINPKLVPSPLERGCPKDSWGGVRPFFPAGRACPELAEGGWG